MTAESAGEFNDRRAIEENFLAEQATDSVQSIPHDQLSKLHADEARTTGTARPATEVKAVDGSVVIVAASEVTSLTRTPRCSCPIACPPAPATRSTKTANLMRPAGRHGRLTYNVRSCRCLRLS